MKPLRAEKIHDRKSADMSMGSVAVIAIVPDPYSTTGERIEVVRNVRDDPLAGMLSRRQIDEAQFNAGRRWQRLHENSTIGGIQAVDPAKEAVDGGSMREPITDQKIRAFRELADAYKELGPSLGRLVFDILAERQSIMVAAANRGAVSAYQVKLVGSHFRGALEKLAVLWGFAGRS